MIFGNQQAPAGGASQNNQGSHFNGMVLDSEESKNIAVVHKTNQGYSGKDLWKLKQERPELFGGQSQQAAAGASGGRKPPQGFTEVREMAGWFFGPERQLFWEQASGKLFCRDPESEDLTELHRGDDLGTSLSIRGDAATCASASAASRHVIISDLHRAAASMKLDFAHHDAPAAMYAVYDGHVGSGAVAEAAAKGLHVRLLPRLAQHRGRWPNERLERTLLESVELLAAELGVEPGGLGLAVALLLGGRITLVASGGALCVLFGGEGVADGSIDNLEVLSERAGTGARPCTHCAVLGDSHLGVLLSVSSVRQAGFSPERLRSLARAHVVAERPRAACVAVLEAARGEGAQAPLVAAAVRVAWAPRSELGDVPKRPRTESQKVRCRHILLRHSSCQAAAGERKPKATRSLGEAEVQLLRLLWELALGGAAAFTARCRALSECDTALRGGDLAGDLGWLDRDEKKNRKVPAAVVRAAFTLTVGQLSDIVSSERGLHLLLRTA